MFENAFKELHNIGIVPVVAIDDANKAEALADALIKGGIPTAEVTFRTDAAEEAIKKIHIAYPDMLVGAGTVLTVENCEKAVAAGAKFIVAPGYDEEVVNWCISHKIPVCPGVCTSSDVQKGIKAGLNVMKFFPAEASGGINMLKNLGGPFPNLKFMPTGGVNLNNLQDYVSTSNVVCVGGTWMVKSNLINGEKWDEITQICKEAVLLLQGFRFAHVGIYSDNKEKSLSSAARFAIFNMKTNIGDSSTFMDSDIELCYKQGFGSKGHIAYKCFDVDRSINYLAQFGFTPNEASRMSDKIGTKVIYFNEEVEGFALHLIRG
ncbi:MAG: bifunctional 4-hydroxy-2-oxoglutarate aldolase/2-dehydro-3-deoxy-phosphogluconate aldolase [Peptostreptococcaceae bacterium]|nr:bifunctional 4-hydroxy-2-oxoglutarate aldolase/2-dehydro-3-deoxy-phosphogluconate aldolase [Peptostreptococcaceae bacterium]